MDTARDGVRYEDLKDGVVRIVLDRPETRNAQDKAMLYALNDAFDEAGADDDVKVVVLAADGPHFSSGHDLRDAGSPMTPFEPVSCWGGFELPGAEGWMAVEEEIYLGLCRRWRNFPKPTIASVQGKAIAGALMLVWVCDLVVAADNAQFSDPVVAFGVGGVEYFAHPWELGPRKAKEMLFTGAAVTADEAHRLGMVNHVVPRPELDEFTLDLARAIASKPSMGLKLAKQAVNQALDAQGQWTALQTAFGLHQLAHSHNMQRFGSLLDPAGLGPFATDASRIVPPGHQRVRDQLGDSETGP
ncbi:enoyl-CoA hydratase [Sporichthya brevicatena]|uniref:Enoyl-CoA hydratase n=1 Tax=Sporichthya brevicatena TaxID=171442 RepID=A0ABN1G4F5_9ACTN